MSIATYSDLQTSVAGWLHRSKLSSIVPDLIVLGELRIFRDVRCRQMETALNSTIASGVIAVPADYLSLKFAYVDGAPTRKLTKASADQIYEQFPLRSSDSKPQKIAREGSNFIFGPYPDGAYTIKGIYYAKPTSIVSSENAVFLESPDLYLFAALCEAAPYLKDDNRIAIWEAKFAAAKASIEAQEDEEEGSGGGLHVVAA